MNWVVRFHPAFEKEYAAMPENVQEELLAHLKALEQMGPSLGRPRADTLKSSRHSNMKELRFGMENSAWRFAFAFDPLRQAVVLCGGDKRPVNENLFYSRLIDVADARFDAHLEQVEQEKARSREKDRNRGIPGRKR